MNILLVVRSEIISIFILIFFIIYNKVCSKYREGKDYFKGFALTSLGHAVMGLVTEITVNKENFPVIWNNVFHIIFFVFALLFSLTYFKYAVSLILPKNKSKVFLVVGYVISSISILVMIFSPIEYLQGNGTKYSAGLGPTLCYALGFVLMSLSDVLIIIYRKKINTHTVLLLIPLSIMTLVFMVIQIIVPEFLFTGCALTITVVGVFFAIENPISKFQSRAFVDADTQTWSKNCYDFDLANTFINKKLNADLIYVLADINGLKIVNDNYGHLEGDALIKLCADAMMTSMKHAYKVYRIGGDEFAAIYLDVSVDLVNEEIAEVKKFCSEKSKNCKFTANMAIGFAERNIDESINDVIERADIMMYAEKNTYYQKNEIERRKV